MEYDPLAAYLDALARDDCYRVEQVLKTAPHERTEVVYFVGANAAELGPFVRKRISGEAAMGEAYRQLLTAQRAGRRFRHLPRVYDAHESDGDLVVIMEYVQGRTLRDEVYARDASLELARRWFPLLCDGVMELHEQFPAPLIHRDLKPTNVLVSDAGLTIIDFGIARTFRAGAQSDTAHFGTRSYAPPEQYGYGQTDARSDVYALGMLLYYLLTECDPSPALATEGFSGPEVPDALRPVLARACAFDPAARYQSVRELKAAFAEAAGDGGVSARSRPALAEAAGEPRGRFATRMRDAFASIKPTEIVGLVWDAALVAVWLFFMLVLVAIIPELPADDLYGAWPFWLAALLFGLLVVPLFTGLLLLLLDVRVLKRILLKRPDALSWPVRVVGAALVIFSVIAVLVIMGVAGSMGLPTSPS